MTDWFVLLVRHAKAEAYDASGNDFDRELSASGAAAAAKLGHWAYDTVPMTDLVLCSSARRTVMTADQMGLGGEERRLRELYLASAEQIFAIIERAPPVQCIAVIGHNPGIGELASRLLATPPDHPRFQKYPTGAAALIRFSSALGWGVGELKAFITPHDFA